MTYIAPSYALFIKSNNFLTNLDRRQIHVSYVLQIQNKEIIFVSTYVSEQINKFLKIYLNIHATWLRSFKPISVLNMYIIILFDLFLSFAINVVDLFIGFSCDKLLF